MQEVSVETPSLLERKIHVTVPAKEIDEAVEKRLKELTKTIKLEGFRPGKVPASVVKNLHGQAIRDEIIFDLIKKTLYDALVEKKIEPVSQPNIESFTAEPGQPLKYTASFEVYPEIQVKDLAQLKVEKTIIDITDQDVEILLQKIRKQHTEWDEVERPAQKEDRLVVDFEGSVEGKPIEGGVMKDAQVILGSKSFIPGFEEGLMGATVGENRELDITFPQKYFAEQLAGKPAKFAVKVKSVAAPRIPELDENFAKKMGVADGDLKGMYEQVRKYMEYESKRAEQTRLKTQVFDQLLQANPVELPQALLEREMHYLHEQMHEHEGKKVRHTDHDPSQHPELKEVAQRRVSLALIIGEIIKKYQIKVDPERVRKHIEAIAATYERPEQVINWYYGDKKRLTEIESVIIEEQVVDKILEEAHVKEKHETYAAAMLEGRGE